MRNEIVQPPKNIRIKRLIGKIGEQQGPTLFFFGGMHGNEMAGVKALKTVFEQLNKSSYHIQGTVIGIRGNIPAQLHGKRFLEQDLNRLWTKKNITKILTTPEADKCVEEKQLTEIYQLVEKFLKTHSPPYYFIDIHTTSSKTLPFITINDALINRRFSRLFPVPIVLGIEEHLEGPLLSLMNEKGYVSLGFESGQHTEEEAVVNAIAFIWLTLAHTGVLSENAIQFYKLYFEQLKSAARGNSAFYEVAHRHALKVSDDFKMSPGFESFQAIKKGTALAVQNEVEVITPKDSVLFMPLYQEQGEEGFFLIRTIPQWVLKLSRFLRKKKLDNLLTILPGIRWSNVNKENLTVDIRVARFYAKAFFHLFGYRNRTIDKAHILMQNRESRARNELYTKEWWY